MNEKILPRPVLRDGNGKLISDHTPRDFFLKLQEETFEAVTAMQNYTNLANDYGFSDPITTDTAKRHFAEEVADIITVCISMLESRGIDEQKRSEIFAKVNAKNERRGYFRSVG